MERGLSFLSSGYNNIANDDGAGGDGVGRLYIVKASGWHAGHRLSPISTGVGSTTNTQWLQASRQQAVNPSTDATIGAVLLVTCSAICGVSDINDTLGATGTEAFKLAALKDGPELGSRLRRRPLFPKPRRYIVLVGTGSCSPPAILRRRRSRRSYGIIDDRNRRTDDP